MTNSPSIAKHEPQTTGTRHKMNRESQLMIQGGYKSVQFQGPSIRSTSALSSTKLHEEAAIKYGDFPLVQNMVTFQKARTAALENDGNKQIFYPKSTDGWIRTLLVLEGRALDKILLPWCLVNLNAVVWTLVSERNVINRGDTNFTTYESIFGLILSSALSFLLVFRLNRSAERFWMARMAWGIIVAAARVMVGGILVHGRHNKTDRDEVIRWIAGFSVVLTHFMRGIREIRPDTLLGILTEEEIKELEKVGHPPIRAAEIVRHHLNEVFRYDETTPIGIAQGHSQRLDTIEKELNVTILQMGALERIRATPLPLVYVTHLRTFLLCFLFAMPYIWESDLGYATIPTVALTSFALLGLEGAAMEVEAPFLKDRPNHLNMDAYCLLIISNIAQQIRAEADREIRMNQATKYDPNAETHPV